MQSIIVCKNLKVVDNFLTASAYMHYILHSKMAQSIYRTASYPAHRSAVQLQAWSSIIPCQVAVSVMER